MNLVIFFCYTFVLGTALPMILAPEFPAWSVKFVGFPLTHWFFLLSLIFAVLAFLFYKNFFTLSPLLSIAEREKKRWSASQVGGIAFLGLASLALSVGNYYRAVDTSSLHHIRHFLDSSATDKTLIRGTIVQDPDDRGQHAFIDIQPEEIVKFSDKEIEVDLNHPQVEFRTKVERVIDGDTIELFESPPLWLFPEAGLKAGRDVRLLGLNAPEIPHPKRNAQEAGIEAEPGGEEAKEFLRKLVEGKSVILKIAKSEPQDHYGRWLALLYLAKEKSSHPVSTTQQDSMEKEESVNEIILKNNHARVAFVKTEGLVHLKPTPPIKLSGKTGLIRAKVLPSIDLSSSPFLSGEIHLNELKIILSSSNKTNDFLLSSLGWNRDQLLQLGESEIISGLNKILQNHDFGQLFFDESKYTSSPKLNQLWQRYERAFTSGYKLRELELLKLNRALLESVYPRAILRTKDTYASLAYGQRVEVVSALLEPRRLTNPAGFDYGKFLLARGVYGMTLPIAGAEQIRLLGEGGTHPLVTLSLNLKKKMTAAIRETMPYPESAFLGGVTLGLRGGVPEEVKRQFQATGIAHVLSVSGLHVGFVAVLLFAISKVFGLPKKVSFIFMVFGLTVFAIITGASPATVRACLMFSIGQFIYTFCEGFGLRRTTVLTIPLAAFMILLMDPLKLPDGSFVLSFMAVWSLAHLSGPVEKFFNWNTFTKGFLFFPYFFSLLFLTLVSLVGIAGEITIFREKFFFFRNFPLMNELLPHWIWTLCGVYILGTLLYFGFKWRGIDLIEKSYQKGFLRGLLIFTCAQLAILLGMTWPLSSIYFQRFSISGSFANFLAIPLIGFIVQYGLIASSLITMTRLFFEAGSDSFMISVLGLSYTPIGFAVLISGLILIFLAGTLAFRVLRNIQDPFFNIKEEVAKYVPSMIFILCFFILAFMEKNHRAATELALRIQAFNWTLCEAFLSMAKNWGTYIPYPYVDQLTPIQTTAYYSGILLLACSLQIPKWLMAFGVLSAPPKKGRFSANASGAIPPVAMPAPKWRWVGIGSTAIFLVACALYVRFTKETGKLSLTFFDCGQGNAILIHTPSGKAILIDGGWGGAVAAYDAEASLALDRGEAKKKRETGAGWDFGDTIALALSKYKISALSLIVNTSPRPGNLSAIPYLVENFPVKEVVLPYAPEKFLDGQGNLKESSFFQLWGLAQTTYISQDGREIKLREPDRYEPFIKTAMKLYADLAANKKIKVRSARAGEILYQEEFESKKLLLTVLHPRGELKEGEIYFKEGDDPVGSRSLILKLTYGEFSCLIPPQVSLKTIEAFLEKRRDELKSDILLLPKHGHPFWNPEEWLSAVKPKAGIIQYGWLPATAQRFASFRMQHWYLSTTEKRLRANEILPLRTDQLGAVVIESDGSALDLKRDLRWMLSAPNFKDTALSEGGEKLRLGIE